MDKYFKKITFLKKLQKNWHFFQKIYNKSQV